MEDNRKQLIGLIKAMNEFAAGYSQPVEAFSNTFFTGPDLGFKPELIRFMKDTLCTKNIDSVWISKLVNIGYERNHIKLLQEIILREGQRSLQEELQHYANNPRHATHSIYHAIECLVSQRVYDTHHNQYLEDIVKGYPLYTYENALSLYLKAHDNMATVTPLASTFRMTAEALGGSFQASNPSVQALLELEANCFTQAAIKSYKTLYLQHKSEALIEDIIAGRDTRIFASDLKKERELLDLCGEDIQALKDTFDVLSNVNSKSKLWLGLQKIIAWGKKPSRNDTRAEYALLATIAEIYEIDPEKVSFFTEQAGSNLPELKSKVYCVSEKLLTLREQLRVLFGNNKPILKRAEKCISEQAQGFFRAITDSDLTRLENFSNRLNIVNAFVTMLRGEDESKENATLPETIQGLADFIRDMKFKVRADAINTAIIEVLVEKNMTFDAMILGLNKEKLDKKSPLFKLRKAIDTHQNFFMRMVSFFYPIETKTAKFFREKLQSQNNPDRMRPPSHRFR